jgi:SPIRAL1-like protein
MSRGGSAGGGQSSLVYLFGNCEPAKLVAAPSGKATPIEKPAPTAGAKQIPAGIPVSQANNYLRSQGQNAVNFIMVCLLSIATNPNSIYSYFWF